jgi:ElaB/YqjD/DUF883 family membrane-anchored ribosome-binding protein
MVMSTETEAVREDIAATRGQLAATVAELESVVADRILAVKQSVDPRHYAAQYPWAAVGVALGLGFAVALTGADRKAAAGVVEGAKHAGEAIGDGAEKAKDLVMDRIHGDGEQDGERLATEPAEPGIREKFASAVDDMLHTGLTEILRGIGQTRGRVS